MPTQDRPHRPPSRRTGAATPSRPAPVRLTRPVWSSPFAPGREIAFARVEGNGLERLGIREGDHVALARHVDVAESEVAAIVDDDGTSALWACTREGARLRLRLGVARERERDDVAADGKPPEPRFTARHARVRGVVVAVLRRDG